AAAVDPERRAEDAHRWDQGAKRAPDSQAAGGDGRGSGVMATGRRTWAYPATALASLGLAISLWLPWYSFKLPDALINQAVALSQQFGALGPIVRQGAEIARNLGPIHLTAWQVFQQMDIV